MNNMSSQLSFVLSVYWVKNKFMKAYIHYYNEEHPHRKLNMKTPFQFKSEYRKR